MTTKVLESNIIVSNALLFMNIFIFLSECTVGHWSRITDGTRKQIPLLIPVIVVRPSGDSQ